MKIRSTFAASLAATLTLHAVGGPKVEWETGIFTDAQTPPTVELLFEPTGPVEVVKADHSATYQADRDYTVEGHTVTRTKDSRIPLLSFYKSAPEPPIYRFADEQGRIFYSPGGNTKHLVYDIEIRYEPKEGPDRWQALFQGATSGSIPAAIEKLKSGGPFLLAVLGDSISVGAQASGQAPAAPPARPGYAQQLTDSLGEKFPKASITLENPSVGGKTSAWGVEQAPALAGKKPDLAVIAFGMNDGSGNVPTAEFRANTEKIVASLRADNPDLSLVLLASFLPNPDTAQAKYVRRKRYAEELRDLAAADPNMAFADMGVVSERIVAGKKFPDVSGNIYNHPNDYLMRSYCDLILTTIAPGERHPR